MLKNTLLPIAILLLAGCSGLAPEPDPGFEVVTYDRHSAFQAAAGTDFSLYTRVRLERATVEFRENWVKDQRRLYDNVIREDDQRRIKTGMADLVEQVLSRELAEEGYTVVTDNGSDVMLFTPRIMELDVYAPDRVKDYIGESLADSKGRMRIELDIHDSVDGQLLATSWQRREDPYDGRMERANSVTNRQAARLMLMRWTDWLFKALATTGNPAD
jgi:hypothetical protein